MKDAKAKRTAPKETKNKNAEAKYVKCNAKDINDLFCFLFVYTEYLFVQFFGIFRKKLLSVKEKPNKRQAKPKAIKDPNQPKRPPTAFFVYLYAIP